jgi:Domain of unknown function (DUF3883)
LWALSSTTTDVAEDWSAAENAAIVADYRAMLSEELRGRPYNKAEHNRNLLPLLKGRGRAAIEFKHANISAALIEMGFPYIAGYKERVNVQESLRREVEAQIVADVALQSLANTFVTALASPSAIVRELDEILVAAPKRERSSDRVYSRSVPPRSPRIGFDYLAEEARNSSLGLAGEQFVLEFERRSLWAAGKRKLSERVEHVAQTRGDGLGYDILSFETGGRERFIEVKTTGLGIRTPFYASKREVTVSEEMAERFHLYRVFRFRERAQLFVVSGALSASCLLDPVEYRATVA